jgi:hypothetical protein
MFRKPWPRSNSFQFTSPRLPGRPIELVCSVDEPIQLPINGILDLHTFPPRHVKDLVPDYLQACRERGILLVRIIHGKGTGQLRQTVRSLLSRHPQVISFADDHSLFGGWGATVVELKPGGEEPSSPLT